LTGRRTEHLWLILKVQRLAKPLHHLARLGVQLACERYEVARRPRPFDAHTTGAVSRADAMMGSDFGRCDPKGKPVVVELDPPTDIRGLHLRRHAVGLSTHSASRAIRKQICTRRWPVGRKVVWIVEIPVVFDPVVQIDLHPRDAAEQADGLAKARWIGALVANEGWAAGGTGKFVLRRPMHSTYVSKAMPIGLARHGQVPVVRGFDLPAIDMTAFGP